MNDDWKSLNAKAFLNRGIRMSLRLTPNAHRKNRLVIRMNGATYRRSVKDVELGMFMLGDVRILRHGPEGARRDVNTLTLFLQPQFSTSGLDGVHLRSMAQMPQFTIEASWRVSIQQLRCAAEFRQIPEEYAEDSLCKGSAACTLAHASLTLSNADRCVAFSPLYSVELARLRVHAFVDCGLGPPQKGNCDVPVAQAAQSVNRRGRPCVVSAHRPVVGAVRVRRCHVELRLRAHPLFHQQFALNKIGRA